MQGLFAFYSFFWPVFSSLDYGILLMCFRIEKTIHIEAVVGVSRGGRMRFGKCSAGGKRFTWGKGFPGGDCAVEGNNASFPGPVSQPLALLRSHWVGPNYFFAAVGQLILTVLVEITTFGITFSIAYWIMVLNEEIQYFINPFILFCSVVLCVYMILFCKQSEC